MMSYLVALVNLAALGAGIVAAAACKPSSGGQSPPATTATATQTFSYTPSMFGSPGAMGSPGAQADTGATAQATRVGCASSGTEPVPNTPGIRECCAKLWKSDACMQSACWSQGAVATFQAKLQSGECSPQ